MTDVPQSLKQALEAQRSMNIINKHVRAMIGADEQVIRHRASNMYQLMRRHSKLRPQNTPKKAPGGPSA
jgi:hypothetical protein